MAEIKTLDARKKKLVEFLSEDFRDTALHMRDTDRKIEFTFQLFAGAFSITSSILISIFAYVLGSDTWDKNSNIYVLQAVCFLLVLVWLFTWWAFLYAIKGTKMKAIYINRMNFLRNEIYTHLGINTKNSPSFLFTEKLPVSDNMRKVGMVDMFPIGLRSIMIILPIPIFIILYYILSWLNINLHWVEIIIPVIIVAGIFIYTQSVWARTIRLTKQNIDNSWIIPKGK